MDKADSLLVRESLEGNTDSYEALIRKYENSVYNLAYRMTNSPADAQDMTQDTFIKAYKKLEKYNDQYSFKNWLLTICSNQTKNIFRKRIKRREIEEGYLEQKALESRTRNINKDKFEEALRKLSPDFRIALTLKHVEGCSYEEISDILSIGVSAAKMRVMRGKEELKHILNL